MLLISVLAGVKVDSFRGVAQVVQSEMRISTHGKRFLAVASSWVELGRKEKIKGGQLWQAKSNFCVRHRAC